MRSMPAVFRCLLCLGMGLISSSVLRADDPSPADLDHFEKKIRPLLVQHCHECHGPAGTAEGNLRLDGQSNWLKGGDTGPAIVPGKPDDSSLIKAIRYGGDIEMPPTGKLPPEVIKTFEEWVARGARAPKGEGAVVSKRVIDIDKGRDFWSYKPVTSPSPLEVKNQTWAKVPLDDFILAKLEQADLTPSPEASREVLARRLYFDLWGLPPTPEQIDAFVNDESPEAYEKLVDQLLDSKHFGERFGRHWLDIARFGESLTLRGFVLPNAWRYRDYVIGAFNRDLPYDQFVRQQLAGDLLLDEVPSGDIAEKRRRAVALTFLTLGNNNLEEQDKKQLDMDVVDEQLDVLSKAFLAQTITCARCHDHKFDPIPTKDYYALAGILRSTQLLEHENVSKWIEAPLVMSTAEAIVVEKNERLLAENEKQLAELQLRIGELKSELPEVADAKKVVAPSELPGIVVDDTQAKKVGLWQSSQSVKPYIGEGYLHDQDAAKGEKTLTFSPKLPADGKYEVRLAYTSGDNRSDAAPVTVFSADGEKTVAINMKIPPPIDGRFVSLGEFNFESAGQSFVIVSNEGAKGHVIADAVQFLQPSLPSAPKNSADNPLDVRSSDFGAKDSASLVAKRVVLDQLLKDQQLLEDHRKAFKDDIAKRPKSMAPRERKEISDCAIHIRGSVHTLGEIAPRGFLQVATTGPAPLMPTNQSGRKELADWIASKSNPLTARVYVNRIWHWLFGAGLVRSVDNFGSTGELPSHSELLDHLAAQFMKNGWSTKKLIRTIVLSKTYRQASRENDQGLTIDPENRLHWRMNRKRLEAECIRDAMLFVSDRLDECKGGPTYKPGLAADYGYAEESPFRSVYLPVFRNALPGIFEPFDFADPSMVVGARNVSTTSPQSLFMLNSALPRICAEQAAKTLLSTDPLDEARLNRAFRISLGRPPTKQERVAAEAHLEQFKDAPQLAWTSLLHAIFCSLDFRYRD